MPRNWSNPEIDAIVEDYFNMLRQEQAGRRYNKTEHRHALMETIDRSKGSIEHKHMNISAVLESLGLPYIDGYKPYRNIQQALFEAVAARLDDDLELHAILRGEASAVRERPPEFRIEPSLIFEDAPTREDAPGQGIPEEIHRIVRKFEAPAERDARNRKLGHEGEQFIFEAERHRLSSLSRPDLADEVRWVARDDGDGYGFDILSFRGTGSEANKERWLEVKTTNGSRTTPFFITRNELRVSEERPDLFRVVRLFDFHKGSRRAARAYRLEPPLKDRVTLTPAIYSASP